MKTWKHISTKDYDWNLFGDKHGRETSKVKTFFEGNQFIWEASLKPNYLAESHWHPYDIVQIFLEGEFISEGEGSFFPGDIRWVKAGKSTIESAGNEGSRFYLIALGGNIPIMWDDLYEVPDDLKNQLTQRGSPVGNANINELPFIRLSSSIFEKISYLGIAILTGKIYVSHHFFSKSNGVCFGHLRKYGFLDFIIFINILIE